MSGLIPITVNTPPGEEAHIHAEDDASVYLSLFGGDGVSTNGQSCKATVLSNNKVRIADGIICVGGHFARIPYGDYIDCEIDSGQSGKNRNDIIVARIKTTGTGGIDTYTCEVKKGTAGSTATDPEIVQEDLYKAGKVRELPLYRVKIEGLSITAVEQLFTLRKTNEELEKELESLNSKLNILNKANGNGSALRVFDATENLVYGCWQNGLFRYGGYYDNGAPSDWAGIMLVSPIFLNGEVSGYLKVAWDMGMSQYIMKNNKDGSVAHAWTKM
jgi:hypothetical protein